MNPEPSSTPAAAHVPQPTPEPKGPKVSTPDKFSGVRGEPAEIFASQIQLYMMAHPYLFRDDRSKVVFAISYLTGAAGSWAQPLTSELFNADTAHLVTFERFVTNFKAMYFDTEKKAKAERALRNLTQKTSVAAYTHEFNIYATATGWETPTLISQYEQGLKKEIRVAMVMNQEDFSSIEQIANLAIKIDSKLHGAVSSATTTFHVPADPNAMDISAGFVRLSDDERARRLRTGSCFRCNIQGHLASDCPESKKKNFNGEGRGGGSNFTKYKNRVAELEAKLASVGFKESSHSDKGEGGSRSKVSKNGGAQD
jgi:hypothetical protein